MKDENNWEYVEVKFKETKLTKSQKEFKNNWLWKVIRKAGREDWCLEGFF